MINIYIVHYSANDMPDTYRQSVQKSSDTDVQKIITAVQGKQT